MLNRYRNQLLVSFYAQVFMCQHRATASGLGYWNLRLLAGGTMIEAFHWDKAGWPARTYRDNDELLVGGRWTTKAKTRFQILELQLMMRNAANDDCYSTHEQLVLDLVVVPKQYKKG